MAAANEFPRGTVTFLFTDIEGSTVLWERNREAMRQAVDLHIALLDDAIAATGGIHFKTVGDAVQAAFHTAPDALTAAVAGQRALLAEPWPEEIGPLRVRMALHAGTATPVAGDYLAPALNRLSRTLGLGHGGQILVTGAARGLLAGDMPEGVGLRSLGEHALRGLQEPEEVFQVVASGLEYEFPPLRSLAHHPTNLLVSPTPIVGRDDELAAVTRLLGVDMVRLVTLTGAGGSGKTRLALEVGAELLDEFVGGVYLVDLSALRDPALLFSAIATTLGLRETHGQTLLDTLTADFARQPVLLVLDNFEQVVDAAAALASLLAACPALRVLVTSREPLRIRAEREFLVEPLGLPNVSEPISLDALEQSPAFALFVARAIASNPGFVLTSENATAVADICRRLDGLPLAIELAAARTRLLPPAALLARLDKSLTVLTGGARDLPTRQRTLRDAIAWSHDLLDDEERTLFRRFGVFAGGWTLEAAAAIVDLNKDVDVLGGLERLIEQSLVRIDAQGRDPRYTMLATVREFAAEQLVASGEAPQMRDAHAAYILALAESDSETPLPGKLPEDMWVARLDRDQDNLRAALSWWIERGDATNSLRLAAAAGGFWSRGGRWAEGRTWLERALALEAPEDARGMIQAIAYAGAFARSQGQGREAIALLEPGLAIVPTQETLPWHMLVALRLAQAYSQVREFDRALAIYPRALELAKAANDRNSAHEIRWSMAYTANSQGDSVRAREIADAILTEERDGGEHVIVAATLQLLAWIALAVDDLDGAADRLAEARRAVETAKTQSGGILANLLIDEAVLAYRRGELATCAAKVSAWLPRARQIGSLQRQTLALLMFASIASHLNRATDAARWFGALYAALAESEHGMHLEPAIRPWHEADINRTREAIGEEAFDRAWSEGSRLLFDDALSTAEETVSTLLRPAADSAEEVADGAVADSVQAG